ncbi:MAG: SDR family oxidoreductase [Acidimicrobiia bacterium]|jgi:NAD(P)-dependent dehydrogenase (short-subunit alcohol dehydrogenase family)
MSAPLSSPSTPVVVTGGGSGIGREVCRALAEVGRPIAAWDRNAEGAAETAQQCAALGVASCSAAVDVRDTDAIQAALAATLDALGAVGGLVHAAGVPMGNTADPLSPEEFDLVLDVNLRAEAVLVRELLPALRAAGPGSGVVGISSIEGLIGHGNIPAYTASKHGLIGLTRSLAARLGPEGIRVNAVCPGYIETPMFMPVVESGPDVRASFERKIPMGRLGKPDEIARLVRFLLSDDASYMHGAAVVADGGVTAVGGQEYTPL